MKTLWECKSLEFGDLPTLQEAIRKADARLLAREVAEIACRDEPEASARKLKKRIRKAARGAISEMRDLDSKSPSKKWVVVACGRFDWNGRLGAFRYGIDAVLVGRSDVKALAGQKRKRLPLQDVTPIDMSLTPWRKVLSFRIWLGASASRKERYQALADVVWEMTFFGWSAKSSRKKQKKFIRNLEEQARAIDEGKEKLMPSELAFRKLGLEASTDDYDNEFHDHMHEIERSLNRKENDSLNDRIADLGERLARGHR